MDRCARSPWTARLSAIAVAVAVAVPVAVPAIAEPDPAPVPLVLGPDDVDTAVRADLDGLSLAELTDRTAATATALTVTDTELAALAASLDDARPALAELVVAAEAARSRHTTLVGQLALAVQARDTAVDLADRAATRLLAATRHAEEATDALEQARRDAAAHATAVLHAGPDGGRLALLDGLLSAGSFGDAATDSHLFSGLLAHNRDVGRQLDDAHQQWQAAATDAARSRRAQQAAADRADAALDHVADLVAEATAAAQAVANAEATQAAIVTALTDAEAATAAQQAALHAELADLRTAMDEQYSRFIDPASGTVCPVVGSTFVDDWHFPRSGGRLHKGKDMFAPTGTPIVSTHDGTVRSVDPTDSYRGGSSGDLGGITVSVWTQGGAEHWYYAHLDGIAPGLAVGDAVQAGQLIGWVGNTGNARSTPPHLHIGHYVAGVAVNPHPLIQPACNPPGSS